MERTVTLPVKDFERLVELAVQSGGRTDMPSLMLVAEARRLIHEAKARP